MAANSQGGTARRTREIVSEWSLALIGNASGTGLGRRRISIRGVFDEETRRKPLVFAADAGSYGI